MPRLTNQDYLDRHQKLSDFWLHDRGRFSNLSADQQLDLHAYYVPIKAWTDHELLEHRDKVTKKRPSLPNKAGKVYQSLLAGKVQPRAVTYGPVINKGKLKGHRISIRSVVQPEPDLKKLADALVSLAREQIEREKREQRERGKAA